MSEGNLSNKLHIILHVYDQDLAVNIPREEEEYYRRAGKLVTDTINTYANIFKGRKSDKEIMYMALVDIALKYEKTSVEHDAQPYKDILAKLTSEIEDALEE